MRNLLTEDDCQELRSAPLTFREMLQAAARLGAERERERCAELALEHKCGGEDDIVCRGQNCGMCIAGAIRRGEEG